MRTFSYLLIAVTFYCSQNNSKQPSNNSGNAGRYKLVWADEFDNGTLPDSTRWGYDIGGHGWGNKELQTYTDRHGKNARIENGLLVIEARHEARYSMNYTSARLVTKGKGAWQYGKVEVKAKIPKGRGTWPAIWMLPVNNTYGGWPQSGEIDIMEHVGFNPGVIHGTVHTGAFNHKIGTQKGKEITVPTAQDRFHLYSIEWTTEKIDFLMDDSTYYSFRNDHSGHAAWPFDQSFYLILNIAVGGSWGGKQGVDDRIFPQQLQVDYVRVYQKN